MIENAQREAPQGADQERAQLVEAIKADQPQGWSEQEAGERMATLLDDDGKLALETAAPSTDAGPSHADDDEPTAPNEPPAPPRPVGAGEPWAEANEQAGTVDMLVGNDPTPVSIAQLKAEIQTAANPEAALLLAAHRMEMAKQTRDVAALIPEWRDPARREEIKREIREYAKGKGYSDQEINQVYDARTLALAYRSMRAEQAALGAEPSRAIAERPAAAPRPAASAVRAAAPKRDAAADQLRKTGRLRAAAAVFERYVK